MVFEMSGRDNDGRTKASPGHGRNCASPQSALFHFWNHSKFITTIFAHRPLHDGWCVLQMESGLDNTILALIRSRSPAIVHFQNTHLLHTNFVLHFFFFLDSIWSRVECFHWPFAISPLFLLQSLRCLIICVALIMLVWCGHNLAIPISIENVCRWMNGFASFTTPPLRARAPFDVCRFAFRCSNRCVTECLDLVCMFVASLTQLSSLRRSNK